MINNRSLNRVWTDNIPPLFFKEQEKLLYFNSWAYTIQEGLRINCLDYAFRENVELTYQNDETVLNFGFILSGTFHNHPIFPDIGEQKFVVIDGSSGIAYFPPMEGTLIIPGKTSICIVHIHLSPSFFYDLVRNEMECIPHELRALLQGTDTKPYYFFSGMSLKIRSALDRLYKGPSTGVPARLFYHAIALELIAEQISRAGVCPANKDLDCWDNKNQVIRAHDLLIHDLSSPPSMEKLARKTGLNRNKIQKGFNQLYGVPVYKYFQQCRMKEANRLFHETDMNVSQIAAELGYTNASHFSSAYKKHFGVLPGKHMACIRESFKIKQNIKT